MLASDGRFRRYFLALTVAATALCAVGAAGATPFPLVASASVETQAHGRIETVTLTETTLGVPKSFKVYLPPGYSSQRRYPSLYLFRGTLDEWLNPQQDDSRKGRTAVSIYENLLAKGAVGPMILVFPGLGDDEGKRLGILCNWVAPDGAPGVGNGRFVDYLFENVIPTVDRRFRTLATGEHRAIDGFSVGGWTSVQAAVLHPERFASVGSYDGTFPIAVDRQTVDTGDDIWPLDFFDPIFGKPRQWDAVVAASPAHRLLNDPRAPWARLQWLLERCPPGTPDSDERRAAAFERVLQGMGATSRLGIVPSGRHNWWYADEHVSRTLPLHWQRIQPGQTPPGAG